MKVLSRSQFGYLAEWLFILVVAYAYAGSSLLDGNASLLQSTGEHSESATLPILAEIGLKRYGEIPLWNHYMRTGFPHAGDFINHFWNPVSTIPIALFGGINGMKVSIFLSFLLGAYGQWLLAHVFGLRGFPRLWVAAMFMLSGGLALLWRIGWYELLLGIVWFPWCFAATWIALHRKNWASVCFATICIAMVLTTGGGYYPLYLGVCLALIVAFSLKSARQDQRLPMLRRALSIVGLTAALMAIVMVPWIDGFRFTDREAAPDRNQSGSQPIQYALMNYAVSQPDWFRNELLGGVSGSNWFYIGPWPLALLLLVPMSWKLRRFRQLILVMSGLLVILLLWHANRHTFVRFLYDAVPLLYQWRFPNRLLIVATIPSLMLSGVAIQYLMRSISRMNQGFKLSVGGEVKGKSAKLSVDANVLAHSLLVVLVCVATYDVFLVNRAFAFHSGRLSEQAISALNWLKSYDNSLYYTNVGGGSIIWSWTPVSYLLEMPVLNFKYNRDIRTFDAQRRQGAPFFATPKYQISAPEQPRPENAQQIRDFSGLGVWLLPSTLPFAFSAATDGIGTVVRNTANVRAQTVGFDGTNGIKVQGISEGNETLVVLVSNYPGWMVEIDGIASELTPVNEYLGVGMQPGSHSYKFSFRPTQYYVGLIISIGAIIVMLLLLVSDVRRRTRRRLTTT